jgi:hypothetical protein
MSVTNLRAVPRAAQVARELGRLPMASAPPAVLLTRTPSVRRWRGRPAKRHRGGPPRVPRFTVTVAGVACAGAAFGSIPVVTGYAEAAGERIA